MKTKSFFYCPILIYSLSAAITVIGKTSSPFDSNTQFVQMLLFLAYLPIGFLMAKIISDMKNSMGKAEAIWAIVFILLPFFFYIFRTHMPHSLWSFFLSNIRLVMIMSGFYLFIFLRFCKSNSLRK